MSRLITTATRRGAPVQARTIRILELHAAGLCPREIAALIPGCVRNHVYGVLERRRMHCHPDATRNGRKGSTKPRRPVVKSQTQRRDAHERRMEALILSGEIDRRVTAYRMFSMGATTAAVMAATGGSEEETLRFKRERPTNWLSIKD